jgi:hypothetical protein
VSAGDPTAELAFAEVATVEAFNMMCENRSAVQCMLDHPDVCTPHAPEEGKMLGMPQGIDLLVWVEGHMGCFCDACPTWSAAFLEAFLLLGSAPGSSPGLGLEERMFELMCDFLPGLQCMTNAVHACGGMLEMLRNSSGGFLTSSDFVNLTADTQAFRARCESKNFSMSQSMGISMGMSVDAVPITSLSIGICPNCLSALGVLLSLVCIRML